MDPMNDVKVPQEHLKQFHIIHMDPMNDVNEPQEHLMAHHTSANHSSF
jgi:hypothetical protein